MAIVQNTYTGDGSTTAFSFTFPYLETTDIKVSLDSVNTTAYTLSNATTVAFTTAPGNGVAIRIFRDTATDNLQATFTPGSAIRSSDLNNNFTQNLYVTQETDFDVDTANTTANTAKSNSETAIATANTASTNANSAVSTANTASTNASAAVTTANAASATATTASTNASNAVTTANTASTNASAAVTTANAADANATTALNNSRESDGSGGFNTAIDKANTALTTANSASTTATTADTNASAAVTTANAASATATAASNSVAAAAFYSPIAALANLPGSPADDDRVEVANSTGVESSSAVSGVPAGFVGASDLTVRLQYNSSTSKWEWQNYFASDPDNRYLTESLPVVLGDSTNGSGQITLNCETNSHGIKIKGPPHSAAADYTLTLPDDTGTNGQYLSTNGSGTLSWGSVDLSSRLALTGGTMTGSVTLSGDPTANLHAATKQYVDSTHSSIITQTDFAYEPSGTSLVLNDHEGTGDYGFDIDDNPDSNYTPNSGDDYIYYNTSDSTVTANMAALQVGDSITVRIDATNGNWWTHDTTVTRVATTVSGDSGHGTSYQGFDKYIAVSNSNATGPFSSVTITSSRFTNAVNPLSSNQILKYNATTSKFTAGDEDISVSQLNDFALKPSSQSIVFNTTGANNVAYECSFGNIWQGNYYATEIQFDDRNADIRAVMSSILDGDTCTLEYTLNDGSIVTETDTVRAVYVHNNATTHGEITFDGNTTYGHADMTQLKLTNSRISNGVVALQNDQILRYKSATQKWTVDDEVTFSTGKAIAMAMVFG